MTRSTKKLEWRTANSCASGTCIQVAKHGDRYLIRDSKNLGNRPLSFSADEWDAFVQAVKKDEFRFE